MIATKGGRRQGDRPQGDDLVCGGAGADLLRGQGGDDTLRGGRWQGRAARRRRLEQCRGGGGSDSKRRC